MSKRLPKVILIDMLDAIEHLMEYVQGISFEEYLNDRRLRDAIYHNIIVLGEAANRMGESFLLSHPEIEWHKMISTRNAIIHGYDEIDDKIIWNIIQNILPDLKTKLEKLLLTL
jgi:uncharacterized protein with HEPN domain